MGPCSVLTRYLSKLRAHPSTESRSDTELILIEALSGRFVPGASLLLRENLNRFFFILIDFSSHFYSSCNCV